MVNLCHQIVIGKQRSSFHQGRVRNDFTDVNTGNLAMVELNDKSNVESETSVSFSLLYKIHTQSILYSSDCVSKIESSCSTHMRDCKALLCYTISVQLQCGVKVET